MVRQIWRSTWECAHRCLGKTFKIHVQKHMATIYCQQSPQSMDIGVVTWRKYQVCGSQTHQRSTCWYKDEVCKKCAEAWTLGSCVLENRRKGPKGPWLDAKGPKATTAETPSIQRRVLDVVLAKKKNRDSTRGERRDQLQKLLWKKCGVWLSMTVTMTAPDILPVLMK